MDAQVVLKLIQPYTRIRIAFIARQLNIEERDVEQLLVSLILDGRIQGHIHQVPHSLIFMSRPCWCHSSWTVATRATSIRSLTP